MESSAQESTTWLKDAAGRVVGVTPKQSGDELYLVLSVPETGFSIEVDARAAQRLVESLEAGITFAEMVGDRTFSLDLGDV
ncbi:hypothetical protein R4144_05840 [Gordonia amicalis]|uniref:hypothetical protein n=1 Tax=Gordonia amicalis TaxID=89053 RepID=UPI002953592A|nr:hypothetical protein [Gordonia amicalis]MDV7172915.1 hypothetical protein [Gordonia amicalis]